MSDTQPAGDGERPSYDMVIEAGKVREFASSVKSSNPAYLDDPTPVIPPTFLRAAAFWAPRRAMGAGGAAAAARARGAGASSAAGGGGRGGDAGAGGAGGGQGGAARPRGTGLHGGQEYIFHGPPPRAGDVLSITSRVAERYEQQGSRGGTMQFTVSVQEFRDPSGRLVAEGRTTSIMTSKPTTEKADK